MQISPSNIQRMQVEIIISKDTGCGTSGHTFEEGLDVPVGHKAEQTSRRWCYNKQKTIKQQQQG